MKPQEMIKQIIEAVGELIEARARTTETVMKAHTDAIIKASEERQSKRLEVVEERLTKKIEVVEERLTKKIENVEQKLDKTVGVHEERLQALEDQPHISKN